MTGIHGQPARSTALSVASQGKVRRWERHRQSERVVRATLLAQIAEDFPLERPRFGGDIQLTV